MIHFQDEEKEVIPWPLYPPPLLYEKGALHWQCATISVQWAPIVIPVDFGAPVQCDKVARIYTNLGMTSKPPVTESVR